jgi:hypothetical protein
MCSLFILLSSNRVTLSSAQASNRSEDDRQALLCFKSGVSGNSAGVQVLSQNFEPMNMVVVDDIKKN